uniref:Uncharacterized protein n=1 Tax=Candidatus Kentrum sp. MB TaxID=2138164 RepID=A0A450XRP3_9GAMM|nr:MAG: hypothetical protein BECKMB1821G_GA0114241_10983 [Candidatus Kentron sp. MB]VFK34991.1 MAG: hypothetical protein BECKMB1821I_GA0114274_109411 [Candidatus Kentron sp. MB]VFK77091.1 MAG: hypothetical protein BECKMB1821H_GA0114242_10993 [Candidatus Kentron sp. MB]
MIGIWIFPVPARYAGRNKGNTPKTCTVKISYCHFEKSQKSPLKPLAMVLNDVVVCRNACYPLTFPSIRHTFR